MEITGDMSKTLIKEYLKTNSKRIWDNIEEAEDNPKILASIVSEAISKGLKSSKKSKRADLEYYDKYIKPTNMSLPRIRNSKRHIKNKTLNLREASSSDESCEETSKTKPLVQKKSRNRLELPWLFKKPDLAKEKQQESTLRKMIQRRKRPKVLNRISSKSSITSLHSSITESTVGGKDKNSRVAPPVDPDNAELKRHFKSICKAAGESSLLVTLDGLKEFLKKRYPDYIADLLIRAMGCRERMYFKEFCEGLDKIFAYTHSKMMRLAFRMYDVDKDGKISEKDLFVPFISFSPELYREVFILDLPRILKQLSIKLRINKPKDFQTLSYKKNDVEVTIPEAESLSLKEFSLIFDNGYYPALMADILAYIAKIRVPQKPQIDQSRKVAPVEDEPEDKNEHWQDGDARFQIGSTLGNKGLIDKVISSFRILAENPTKGESKLYLTLYSLTRGFERVFGYANKCLSYKFFRHLFKNNTGAGTNQQKISLLSYVKTLKPLLTRKNANSWAFAMYDGDEDGALRITDLTSFQKEVPEGSKLHNEIQKLINEDMDMNVYRKPGTTKKDITEDVFTGILEGDSVLALEFRNKLLGEKGEEYIQPAVQSQKPTTNNKIKLLGGTLKRKRVNMKFKEPLSLITETDSDIELHVNDKTAIRKKLVSLKMMK